MDTKRSCPRFGSFANIRKGFMLIVLGSMILSGVIEGRTRPSKDLELEALLGRLNKPAVKTIKSEAGEIIDCVDIHTQPALDLPLLKNHTIQMRPSFFPKMDVDESSPVAPPAQIWQKSGSCPDGTIPIRRVQKDDLLRVASIQSFGRKDAKDARVEAAGATLHSRVLSLHGARAEMNVWNISVEPNEWNHNSIVVSKRDGTYVEAGWGVDSRVFGDGQSRIFAYWTTDGSQKTGCFNLLCPGFVQVSQKVTLGAVLYPLSTYGGAQYNIITVIYKDNVQLNWWVVINGEPVGYWPATIFNNFEEAWEVQWAGAILNTWNGGRHTTTQMGSGRFPQERFGKAAFFANVRVMDFFNNFVHPTGFDTLETIGRCYQVLVMPKGSKFLFYYGGPGGTDCTS